MFLGHGGTVFQTYFRPAWAILSRLISLGPTLLDIGVHGEAARSLRRYTLCCITPCLPCGASTCFQSLTPTPSLSAFTADPRPSFSIASRNPSSLPISRQHLDDLESSPLARILPPQSLPRSLLHQSSYPMSFFRFGKWSTFGDSSRIDLPPWSSARFSVYTASALRFTIFPVHRPAA
ncbi:hypothetical protein MSAN_02295700 [Mycena sanguinolenta]|uniref:Uncharacterized protein n=1 Tax=Mycena sanguinolenta TaxID=230812 RepID=A0A8H7CHR7_9AGAR|nr:hypothetical protein MSAN_02295700 [Mycena sanguinolenta]